MTEENVYSPVDDQYDAEYDAFIDAKMKRDEKLLDKLERKARNKQIKEKIVEFNKNVNKASNNYDKIDLNKARGSFTYTTSKKKQIYTSNIRSIEDAVIISTILNNRDKIDRNTLPLQYHKVYDLFNHADVNNNRFSARIYKKDLEPWLNPKVTKAKKETKSMKAVPAKIQNPLTGRMIQKGSPTYKKVFGSIKLKKVTYEPLHNFNVVDYEVDVYCVQSYLKGKLLKKEFDKISDDLERDPTPTYPKLTKLLNKIDYNLNVFITDGEQIEEQTKYKKTINIMIHNEHMYVLKNIKNIEAKIKETKEVDQETLNNINSEFYTNSSKINNGVKYVLENRFVDIEKDLHFKGPFTHSNISFFNSCQIRPVRYNDNNLDICEGIDINQCYFNILKNQNYIYPVQNGNEETEVFEKDDKVLRHGFYYVTFKNPREVDTKMFGSTCWIYGDVLILLGLEKKVTIKYKHIPKNASLGFRQDVNFQYMDVTHYTGHLAKYESCNEYTYKCDDYECQGFQEKFSYQERKYSVCPEGVTVFERHYFKSSGMYAYLAITQYARLQLYQLYNEIMKRRPDAEAQIKKLYTDSITFNTGIREVDEEIELDLKQNELPVKLNKLLLKKYGFTVKYQTSLFDWEQKDYILHEPKVVKKELATYDNVDELLKSNKSFCINAGPGYGKTHMIKNKIIPYLQSINKRFIVASSSKESAKKLKEDLENIDCDVIHQLLSVKESHLDKIREDLRDIDYLIIDECSLLEMPMLNLLEYCKLVKSKLRIILAGDINQCDFSSRYDESFMDTPVFNKIIDHNILTIKWHDKARYSKDYDDFLNKLLTFKNGGRDKKCIEYIKKYFKNQVKSVKDCYDDKNEIKICWTNKIRKELKTDECKTMTTHKAQGKTITENYSIYEVDGMSIKILYTALSRCSDPKLINIYI